MFPVRIFALLFICAATRAALIARAAADGVMRSHAEPIVADKGIGSSARFETCKQGSYCPQLPIPGTLPTRQDRQRRPTKTTSAFSDTSSMLSAHTIAVSTTDSQFGTRSSLVPRAATTAVSDPSSVVSGTFSTTVSDPSGVSSDPSSTTTGDDEAPEVVTTTFISVSSASAPTPSPAPVSGKAEGGSRITPYARSLIIVIVILSVLLLVLVVVIAVLVRKRRSQAQYIEVAELSAPVAARERRWSYSDAADNNPFHDRRDGGVPSRQPSTVSSVSRYSQ